MAILTLIIAIVALVLSILAYQKAGGTGDLKKQVNSLSNITESLRTKTADILSKMEKSLRSKADQEEEEKEGSEEREN
jgi:hypothetical protein